MPQKSEGTYLNGLGTYNRIAAGCRHDHANCDNAGKNEIHRIT